MLSVLRDLWKDCYGLWSTFLRLWNERFMVGGVCSRSCGVNILWSVEYVPGVVE